MNNFKTYQNKFLLGDIHGYWSIILNHLNHFHQKETCYIQVGDFGIGFDNFKSEFEKLKRINSRLVEYSSDLFIIRGNHDNPSWFKNESYEEYKSQLTNIFFIPDYTVLNIDSENYLFIGGAVSIDRMISIKRGFGWWADEVVNFDYEKASELRDIDRIICHTAPDFCKPTEFNKLVYSFAENDSELLKDLTNERSNMTRLVTEIMKNNKIKSFAYGHFHNSYKFYHNDCEFLGLNINQFIHI